MSCGVRRDGPPRRIHVLTPTSFGTYLVTRESNPLSMWSRDALGALRSGNTVQLLIGFSDRANLKSQSMDEKCEINPTGHHAHGRHSVPTQLT